MQDHLDLSKLRIDRRARRCCGLAGHGTKSGSLIWPGWESRPALLPFVLGVFWCVRVFCTVAGQEPEGIQSHGVR